MYNSEYSLHLSDAFRYAITTQELSSLATLAKQADNEENEAGRNPGPNSAAGVLADKLADLSDPRELIVRRSQQRRQLALERDVHPVSLNGEMLLKHAGIPSEGEDSWGRVSQEGDPEEHHYKDGSTLRSQAYVDNDTGNKIVHWVQWDVPSIAPDSEPFAQFHTFGAPVSSEELAHIRSVK